MSAEVSIDQAVLDAVFAHAEESRPGECCGLLVGKGGAIQAAVRARNLADSSSRFLIDPKDHIDAIRAARQNGLDVLGFYHSHPHSAPFPSAVDRDEASYPESVYLIAGVEGGSPVARLFRLNGEAFEEVRLSVRAARAGLDLNRH